jgi:general secretion pathway protein A
MYAGRDLEGIRMLTNLETPHEKLIQIVLTGQPELEALLERHEVRHIRERIAVRARILPLTDTESVAYIQHRLDQASREQVSIFSPAALRILAKAAHGIPRRLNILCDNALMTGFRRREPIISRQVAQQVVAEIDEVQARRSGRDARRLCWRRAGLGISGLALSGMVPERVLGRVRSDRSGDTAVTESHRSLS